MFKSLSMVYADLKILSLLRGKITVLCCSVNQILVSHSVSKISTSALNWEILF